MSVEKIKKLPWEFMADNLDHTSNYIPHSAALGAKYIDISLANAIAILPWREDLVGNFEHGIIASGAVISLIDQTCGTAVMAALEIPRTLATLDLRVDYMRAAKTNSTIFAHAHCYRVTNNIAFVRAFAYESDKFTDDNIICAAQACFMLDTDAKLMGGKNG